MSTVVVVGCVVVALAAIFVLRRMEVKKLTKHRPKVPLKQQWHESEVKLQITEKLFCEVLQKVGHFYKMEPELLRASDTVGSLSNLDSWELSAGEDELREWLQSRGVVELKLETSLQEIMVALSGRAVSMKD